MIFANNDRDRKIINEIFTLWANDELETNAALTELIHLKDETINKDNRLWIDVSIETILTDLG